MWLAVSIPLLEVLITTLHETLASERSSMAKPFQVHDFNSRK